MNRTFEEYRKRGREPKYELGQRHAIVAEHDCFYTLYEVDVVVSTGRRGRHVIVVPVAVSAVSFSVGVMLTEEDSMLVDNGTLKRVESLANAVQSGFHRFRTFPAPERLYRFVI